MASNSVMKKFLVASQTLMKKYGKEALIKKIVCTKCSSYPSPVWFCSPCTLASQPYLWLLCLFAICMGSVNSALALATSRRAASCQPGPWFLKRLKSDRQELGQVWEPVGTEPGGLRSAEYASPAPLQRTRAFHPQQLERLQELSPAGVERHVPQVPTQPPDKLPPERTVPRVFCSHSQCVGLPGSSAPADPHSSCPRAGEKNTK